MSLVCLILSRYNIGLKLGLPGFLRRCSSLRSLRHVPWPTSSGGTRYVPYWHLGVFGGGGGGGRHGKLNYQSSWFLQIDAYARQLDYISSKYPWSIAWNFCIPNPKLKIPVNCKIYSSVASRLTQRWVLDSIKKILSWVRLLYFIHFHVFC